jgi:hypothetical protein
MENAIKLFDLYVPGFNPSKWVLEKENHHFDKTVVFYHEYDDKEKVIKLITEREPCNISMRQYYNKRKLQSEFGWSIGAYSLSTKTKLMPNIAVYCYATLKKKDNNYINIHVINLIGYAFDCYNQPDYIYFIGKQNMKDELVKKYQEMWKLALYCLKTLNLKKFYLYNVGGGAFAPPMIDNFIIEIFEPSFIPLMPEFNKLGIQVIGYNQKNREFNGGFIPDIFDDTGKQDLANTLYVNAWDPWSIIGNGNGRDNSLDGYWGRSTNMSALGWSMTNPYINYISVPE